MPKRKYWTRAQARNETSINALPPEILQHIFKYLPLASLLAVRETCHLWRAAVGGCPALRDKFWLIFPHAAASDKLKQIGRGYKPPPAVPASTVTFRSEKYFKIGYFDSWWPSVAETVTCLSFLNCQYPVAMLRHTPNLQSLELDRATQSSEQRSEELNFKLSNLKKLKLKHSSLGHLIRMITQLKVLECYTYDRSATSMVEFVQSKVQDTLEDLILQAPVTYLEEFTKMTGLGLKRLSLSFNLNEEHGNMMVQFARLNPSIEDLSIANIFDDKVLYEALQALSKLKRLNIKLEEIGITRHRELLKIPNVLPHLKCLHIKWEPNYFIPLSGPKLCIPSDLRVPKLQNLHLENVTLSGDSLSHVLRNTPALHTMTLAECDFDSWPQLLQIITQPRALRHLKLTSLQALNFEDVPLYQPHQAVTNLRYLELGVAGVSSEEMRDLFYLCPQLTELRFGPKTAVDDDLVLEMCRTLTQLERLTVYSGRTTHVSTVNVREFCRNLNHFTLFSPHWIFEKGDLIYFAKHLQSFTFRGIEIYRGISDSMLSHLIRMLDLMKSVYESEYESESDSDL